MIQQYVIVAYHTLYDKCRLHKAYKKYKPSESKMIDVYKYKYKVILYFQRRCICVSSIPMRKLARMLFI